MRLAEQVVIVTGAAGSFGRAIADRFAEEGADLALADVNEAGLEEPARLVRERGRDALTLRCDVTQRADVQRLVDETVAHFGRLTTMVANAGVIDLAPFLDLTDEDWSRVQAVNLTGVFLCDQIAARQMVRQGDGGRIVNMASQIAEIGSPMTVSYAVSKAGVRSLTKSTAAALGPHGIRVNAIGPGPCPTDLNMERYSQPEIRAHVERQVALGRLGEPIDVANVALFLASDETRWMTGETVFVDGGFLLNAYRGSPEYDAAMLRVVEGRSGG